MKPFSSFVLVALRPAPAKHMCDVTEYSRTTPSSLSLSLLSLSSLFPPLLLLEQVNVVVRQRPKQDERQQRRRAERLADEQPDLRQSKLLGLPGALDPQGRGGHGLARQVVEESGPALDSQDACRERGGQGEGDGAVLVVSGGRGRG